MALIISEPQTRKLIGMPQAVTSLDKMFRDRAAGKMRSVPRRRLKGSEKQLNMMAAWHQDSDLICLRSYAAEANTITLYHGRKGGIQAIINMKLLSSLRTGAATVVAAKYPAPANSKVLGIIGPGWQATFQVEAVAETCSIEQVVVYGRTPKRRKDFIKQMSKVVEADWQEVDSVDEAEAVSDILVVSTDSTTPVATGMNLKTKSWWRPSAPTQRSSMKFRTISSGSWILSSPMTSPPPKPTAATWSKLVKVALPAGKISSPWKKSSPTAYRNRGPKKFSSNPMASPTKISPSAFTC